MTNAILIAALAGFASAMLAAAAIVGGGFGVLFTFIAPLPLMIVGIGWHPLLAVLGGATTSAALVLMLRGSAGVMFAVMVMVPAFLAAYAIWQRRETTGNIVGQLCVGAALYGGLVTIMGALSISFDYETVQGHLLKQSEIVYRFMSNIPAGAPLETVNGSNPKVFIEAYAHAVAPVSAAMLSVIYMLNIWLAARIARYSDRLPVEWTPVPEMRLPIWTMPALAACVFGGLLSGYPGFILEVLAASLVIAVAALGYAAVHNVSAGLSTRSLILTPLWLLTFITGISALAMLVAGLAELVFGWRTRVLARRNNRNF
ncbi:MAG: hypothetical protein ACRCWF_01000 [Beijerinckiaceae bacterium]